MRNYLQFVLKEKRLLSFGLTFTFFSSFGQTFLISLFVPFFLSDFNLSNASFGSIYSVATLASAISLPFMGKWIDYLPLKKFSLLVAGGLIIAAFTVSISWHIAVLFIGLLLLRLAGQGLSSHTAQTAMAKFFRLQRGKALSIANLGYPLGEAILPIIITTLIPILSWRGTWGGISVAIGILLIPFILYTLSGKTAELTTPDAVSDNSDANPAGYSLVLNDPRFYMLLPAVLLPPFWTTGLFLYQVSIAEQLGWSAALIASAFVAYAASRVVSSLGIGPIIDKLSARQTFAFHLLPLAGGLLMAYFHPGKWSAFAYMLLLGMTMGMSSNLKSALWAEMYGEESVGTIRSLFSALMVLSTAISPFLLGWLLDNNIAMTDILLSAFISIIVGTLMAVFTFRDELWN
jgi:MFS family permease